MSADPVRLGQRSDDYERGKREGRIDARLDQHEQRLNALNGNIARFAVAVEELGKKTAEGLQAVSSEIRTLKEDARLAEERVKAAAEALAKETERLAAVEERKRINRATALEVTPRNWTVRAAKAAVIGLPISAVIALIAFLTFYFAHNA